MLLELKHFFVVLFLLTQFLTCPRTSPCPSSWTPSSWRMCCCARLRTGVNPVSAFVFVTVPYELFMHAWHGGCSSACFALHHRYRQSPPGRCSQKKIEKSLYDKYIYIYIYICIVHIYIYNCLRFANPAEATGGLEAWRLEARCLRYPGNPFQFQNDLSKFQNNLKCVFSVSK